MIGPIKSDRKVQAASQHLTDFKVRLERAGAQLFLIRKSSWDGVWIDRLREQQRRSSGSRWL